MRKREREIIKREREIIKRVIRKREDENEKERETVREKFIR